MTQSWIAAHPAPLLCAGFLALGVLISPPSQPVLQAHPTNTPDGTAVAPSPTPSPTPSCSPSPSPTTTATGTPTATSSPSPAVTPTGTATASPTITSTPSPTTGASTSAPGTAVPPGSVLINEIAWSGTTYSANDEWIELFNTGSTPLNLEGWRLTDQGDITIHLQGVIPAYGLFLLERTDDTTVASITADLIYTGSLNNNGETLYLFDPNGNVVDSANQAGGGWPAGAATNRASMERRGGGDQPGNWATSPQWGGVGIDAGGHPIHGTPRSPNAILFPSPTPASATPSPSPSPTPPGTGYQPGVLLINELAWAGTGASSSDEWMELYNTTSASIDLAGWELTDGGDIHILLAGSIAPHSFFLLERTDDSTISDRAAQLIYTGGLNNTGETLWLLDPSRTVIDSANLDGGSWPGGSADGRLTMERRGGEDRPGNWGTFNGYHGCGRDADGNPISGTPGSVNSVQLPQPSPTPILGRIVINEVLIRPHYDWEGTGNIDVYDEFIELHNLGPEPVYLRGWQLDDQLEGGSSPYTITGITISPGSYAVFFRTTTRIALNDSGDSVSLLAPDGTVMDQISYLRVRAYNLSYGRLPDGSSHLTYGLWPTPGRPNLLFEENSLSEGLISAQASCCPADGSPRPRLLRLTGIPACAAWLTDLGQVCCCD